MSDVTDRVCRCTCCHGALAHPPDDDVSAPSIGSPGIDTESGEYVCDECWARLASEHEKLMSGHGTARRKT